MSATARRHQPSVAEREAGSRAEDLAAGDRERQEVGAETERDEEDPARAGHRRAEDEHEQDRRRDATERAAEHRPVDLVHTGGARRLAQRHPSHIGISGGYGSALTACDRRRPKGRCGPGRRRPGAGVGRGQQGASDSGGVGPPPPSLGTTYLRSGSRIARSRASTAYSTRLGRAAPPTSITLPSEHTDVGVTVEVGEGGGANWQSAYSRLPLDVGELPRAPVGPRAGTPRARRPR